MNPNVENTKARPDDTVLSIQCSHPSSHVSSKSSHSSSPSLMDDLPPLEYDYVLQQNKLSTGEKRERQKDLIKI